MKVSPILPTSLGIVVLLLVTVVMPVLAAAEEEAPTAEAILDSLVEATGGAEAYARLENRTMIGSIEFVTQKFRIPFTIHQGRPVKRYLVSESDVLGKLEIGTDGEVVWEKSRGSGSRIKE